MTNDAQEPDANKLKEKILYQALELIPYDGWTRHCFETALANANVDLETGYRLFPKGENDLPHFFHKYGDTKMLETLGNTDLSDLRYSEKIAKAVWIRVSVWEDVDLNQVLVKKVLSTYALPANFFPGTKLVWNTADKIWDFMGDTSEDYNWYTKRMILSGIISSTFLFYIGDKSEGFADTRDFINRRISDVMEFEKVKTQAKNNPLFAPVFKTLEKLPFRNHKKSFDQSKYPGWLPGEGSSQ